MAGRCRVTGWSHSTRDLHTPAILARMSDEPAPAPAPAAKPWIRRRTTQIGIVLLLFLVWSIAANNWTDKGCSAIPQSYVLTVQHFGPPSHDEGCDEYGDYTDNYYGG